MDSAFSLNRRTALAFGIAGLAGVAALMMPVGRSYADAKRIYTGFRSGLALDGYDPVAYHTVGKPTKGRADLTVEHDGATWRFASSANRDKFVADPDRYAPQYGGHCAWAAAQGYTAKGDPNHWKIVDSKLYVNYNRSIQRRWEKDIPGFIEAGDKNWPGIVAGG